MPCVVNPFNLDDWLKQTILTVCLSLIIPTICICILSENEINDHKHNLLKNSEPDNRTAGDIATTGVIETLLGYFLEFISIKTQNVLDMATINIIVHQYVKCETSNNVWVTSNKHMEYMVIHIQGYWSRELFEKVP